MWKRWKYIPRQYIDNIFDRFEYIDNLFRKKGQFIEIDLDNKYTIEYLNWVIKELIPYDLSNI